MKKISVLVLILSGLVLGLNNADAVNQPIGWLDSVSSDCRLNGWAVIKETPTAAVTVDVYLDGKKGEGGKLVASVHPDIPRSDVNAYLGIEGDHGFAAAVPSIYHDGKEHYIYVYANDTVTVSISVVLSGVPKPCKTGTASPTPIPSSTLTPTPSPIASPTPTPSVISAPTPTPLVSETPVITPTPTPILVSPTPIPGSAGDTSPLYLSAISAVDVTPFSATIQWTSNKPADSRVEFCSSFSRCDNFTPLVADPVTYHAIDLFGLSPNTRYYYWVYSRDAAGQEAVSPTKTFTTTSINPPIISGISAINITPFSATIQWNTNVPADSQLELCPSLTRCGNNTPIITDLTTYHAIDISGLMPGTRYYYWVKSRDANGSIATSFPKSFLTTYVEPPYISGVTVTGLNESSATINWNTNKPTDARIEYCTTLSHCENYTPLQTTLATSHSVALSGLTPNTRYYYWVMSRDADGNVASIVTRSFTTTAVLPPYISNISVTEITAFSATVQWTTDKPADGQIEFCPTLARCGNKTPLVSALTTSHTINLSGLLPNTRYYFWIYSRDVAGSLGTSTTRAFLTLSQ